MNTPAPKTPAWARAYVRAVTVVAAAVMALGAAGALLAPDRFARLANFRYGVHYLHDAGAFQLGIGVTALLALLWRDRLAVVLAGVLAGDTVHAINHAVDRGAGGHGWDPYLLGGLSVAIAAALALRLAELGLVVGEVGMACSPSLAPLVRQKTVLLTTFRRDGRPVGSPVSIAVDGGRAYVRTYDRAGKVRRLRNDPSVTVAPCTTRGRVTGAAIPARTTLLEGRDAAIASRALARKHPLLQGVVVPLSHRMLRHRTLHYALTPTVKEGWGRGTELAI